jgi:hypothetical protein
MGHRTAFLGPIGHAAPRRSQRHRLAQAAEKAPRDAGPTNPLNRTRDLLKPDPAEPIFLR